MELVDLAQVIAGFGTPVAIVIAGGATWFAKQASDHGHEAATAANDQAAASNRLLEIELKRQKDADASSQRAQALQVGVWVDYHRQMITVRNSSTQPVYDVELFAVVVPDLITGETNVVARRSVLPPASASPVRQSMPAPRKGIFHLVGPAPENEIHFFDEDPDVGSSVELQPLHYALSAGELEETSRIFASVRFRDADERWWRRSSAGKLEEIDKPLSK